MRIKKTSNTRAIAGKALNVASESTTDAYSCDYINDCNTYSTNETFTGKYWIDGKPIYRKIFTGTTSNTYTANSFNFDKIISITGYVVDGNWTNIIPFCFNESNTLKFITTYYNATEGKLYLHYSSDYNSKNYTIVVEYTKSS